MKLSELTTGLDILAILGEGDPEITGIELDSRKVKDGDLFIAIPGFKSDGGEFIRDAVERGARAVVTQSRNKAFGPQVQVADSRAALAMLSREFWGRPDAKLILLGITGTNGKTTTALLLQRMLQAGGKQPSLLSTIHYDIQGRTGDMDRTTPESHQLCSAFRETLDRGGDSVVMEVSSHALALGRVSGFEFNGAAFTNLTHEHLDFHADMDDYFNTKARLFLENLKQKGIAAVCIDDPFGIRLQRELAQARPDLRVVTFGENLEAKFKISRVTNSWQGLTYSVESDWGGFCVRSPMSGNFNVMNIAAATVVALSLGIKLEPVLEAVARFEGADGRFQKVEERQPFAVIVDYAHTPDAFERLLQNARDLTPEKELRAVFGCGGDRDKTKRPEMGRIASQLADRIFVTSDNPRTEDPQAILDDIIKGMGKRNGITVEPDRRKAIELALRDAPAGSCVVIAGKGHETYQEIGVDRFPFDDSRVAREFLRSES